MGRRIDYGDARTQLAKAATALDDLQDAAAKGRATAVSPAEVVRLRIELGQAYARLAAVT